MADSADPDQLASSEANISWLLKKPTDLDIHSLQRHGISGLSGTWVKYHFDISGSNDTYGYINSQGIKGLKIDSPS